MSDGETKGWIALTRDSFKHPIFKREPVTEWEAFARLIRRAAWEDTRHRVGGELLPVARGSFFCTLRDLQLEFMWKSDARVRSFLKRLENERMIERKTNAGKTHVTICKYDDYQAGERKESQALNAPKTQDERTKVTSKQSNKEQVEKKAASAPKKSLLFSLFTSTVSEDVAKAFVEHRKKKRAPLSAHIIDLINKVLVEAEDAGIPADTALNHAMVRGWTGLELDWLLKALAPTPTNGASHERPRNQGGRPATVPNQPSSLAGVLAESRARDQANRFDEDAGGGRDSLGAGRRDESCGDGSGWGGHGGGPSIDAEYSEVIPFQALASAR